MEKNLGAQTLCIASLAKKIIHY